MALAGLTLNASANNLESNEVCETPADTCIVTITVTDILNGDSEQHVFEEEVNSFKQCQDFADLILDFFRSGRVR